MPEDKQVKNRLHLDLRPSAGTRDEEVARVVGLGATQLDDQRNDDGTGWVVLADPEGNEFCILRSQAEVDAGDGVTGRPRLGTHPLSVPAGGRRACPRRLREARK